MKPSRFPLIVTWAVIAFFYIPIVILVANSFNSSRFGGSWESTSLKWYVRLMNEPSIWHALTNTLIIATAATLISMVLGTSAAFALHRFAGSKLQKLHYSVIYTPLVLPEILMGLSLLLFFVQLKVQLGLATIAIDDFVISFFVAGPGSTTLPIKIYSMIKYGAPPLINALSTILLAITFLCVIASQYLSNRGRRAA